MAACDRGREQALFETGEGHGPARVGSAIRAGCEGLGLVCAACLSAEGEDAGVEGDGTEQIA